MASHVIGEGVRAPRSGGRGRPQGAHFSLASSPDLVGGSDPDLKGRLTLSWVDRVA